MKKCYKHTWLLLCVYLCVFGCGEGHIQSVLHDVGGAPIVVESELPPVVWDAFEVERKKRLRTYQSLGWDVTMVDELKAWQETYYDRYVDAEGIAIVGNSGLADADYIRAGQIVLTMTAKRPEVQDVLSVKNGFYMVLFGSGDMTGWFYPPEIRHQTIRTGRVPLPGCSQDSRGGFCFGVLMDGVFAHEFAHAMDYAIITRLDPGFYEQVKQAYAVALASGTWAGLYAESSAGEYWAEGAVVWFYDVGPGRRFETYDALAAHDPLLFDLLDAWFPRVSFAGRY